MQSQTTPLEARKALGALWMMLNGLAWQQRMDGKYIVEAITGVPVSVVLQDAREKLQFWKAKEKWNEITPLMGTEEHDDD